MTEEKILDRVIATEVVPNNEHGPLDGGTASSPVVYYEKKSLVCFQMMRAACTSELPPYLAVPSTMWLLALGISLSQVIFGPVGMMQLA